MTSIKHALLKIKGIAKIEIDKEAEKISLMGHNYELSEVLASLNSMGYPQKGDSLFIYLTNPKIEAATFPGTSSIGT